MNADSTTFLSTGGLNIEKQVSLLPSVNQALAPIYQTLDTHKGGLLISNYEYPNRYSRWDIGFVCPALEIISYQREFTIQALNRNGELLLSAIQPVLANHPHLLSFGATSQTLTGVVKPMPAFFAEEERSKQPSVFSVVRAIAQLFGNQDATPNYLGLYGAFGYDLVFQFETIQARHARQEKTPDCHLFLPTEVTVVDRQREEAYRIHYRIQTPAGTTESPLNTGSSQPVKLGRPDGVIHCDHEPGEFESKVRKIQEGCRRGDFFEVVLSQSFFTEVEELPMTLFQRICERNPSPYTFFFNLGKEHLFGASPEMFARVQGRRLETSPISGTVPVGKEPMETAERIKELITSEKEESELTMCTDVDRNDMSRICVPGSVKLLGRRLLEPYSRLIHTVDHVEGILEEGFDAIDALLCHMWACTLTGSPKPIAMQTIEDLEKSPRGWYSGAVGLLSFNGDLNTGMTIRTVHLKNGLATVRAGATLLYESDPLTEEKETRIKASAFLEATLGKRAPKPAMLEEFPKTGQGKTVLFVDNQDSFVHTLGNYVRQTGAKVITLRAGFPVHLLDEIKPDLVFISPGPKTPRELGVPELVGEAVKRQLPIFGVCLGHQGMAEYFGAKLLTFEKPYHGKSSPVFHNQQGIFAGVPLPFTAGRYHSLYVERASLPECLEITAETEEGIIMGLRHKTLPIATVQFHPESILSLKDQAGVRLIHKVLELIAQSPERGR